VSRHLTAARQWGIVALYVIVGINLASGGVTGREFTAMAVLGLIALVYIVLMDWIAGGGRPE
jgi:hypothetical protein